MRFVQQNSMHYTDRMRLVRKSNPLYGTTSKKFFRRTLVPFFSHSWQVHKRYVSLLPFFSFCLYFAFRFKSFGFIRARLHLNLPQESTEEDAIVTHMWHKRRLIQIREVMKHKSEAIEEETEAQTKEGEGTKQGKEETALKALCKGFIRGKPITAEFGDNAAAMYYHWYRDFMGMWWNSLGDSKSDDERLVIVERDNNSRIDHLSNFGLVSRENCFRFRDEVPDGTCFYSSGKDVPPRKRHNHYYTQYNTPQHIHITLHHNTVHHNQSLHFTTRATLTTSFTTHRAMG